MKFFLRRLSHFIHRRTRSDSALTELTLQPVLDELPRSLSLGDLVQQVGDYSRYPTVYPPTENHTEIPAHLLVTGPSENPSIAIFYVEQCINRLQKENAQLQSAHRHLKAQLELKSTELHSYKTRIASLNYSINKLNLIINSFEQDLVALEVSINQIDQSFVLLLDVTVCGSVFHRTRGAISSGSVFMDAVVDAIRENVQGSHSPWFNLIPPIIGTRSQDHYTSALNITLKTRSDLRQIKNLARYWKSSAKEEEKHKDVITPSGSTLSEVQEVLTTERQKAVDALWSKLKSGELPLRSTVVTQAQDDNNSPDNLSTTELPLPSASSFIDASSLFKPPDPQSIKPQITASAAASIVTINASLIRSSSGESFPSTQSSGGSFIGGSAPSSSTRLGSEDTISPLPRLSLFSSHFWASANSGDDRINGQDAGRASKLEAGEFSTKNALQSLELIYDRFSNLKLDAINEASPTCPADTGLSEVETTHISLKSAFRRDSEILSSDPDEPNSDFEADFVFVSVPTCAETPSPKRRNSLLQSLKFSSKIPRRLSISLSPTNSKINSKFSKRTANSGSKLTSDSASKPLVDNKEDVRNESPPRTRTTMSVRSQVSALATSASTVKVKRSQRALSPTAASPSPKPTIPLSLNKANNTSPLRSRNAIHPKGSDTVPRTKVASTNGSTHCVVAGTRIDALPRSKASSPATKKGSAHSGTPTNAVASCNRKVPRFSATPMENSAKNPRSRLPVQHHRPPLPVPAAKGKENIGKVSAKSSKMTISSSAAGVKNRNQIVK